MWLWLPAFRVATVCLPPTSRTAAVTQTEMYLPPEHSWRRLWDDEALLQVAEHIIQHPHVGGVTLFGVVCRSHGFWLEEGCVVSQGGGRGQQGRRYHALLWRQQRRAKAWHENMWLQFKRLRLSVSPREADARVHEVKTQYTICRNLT